MRGYDLSWAETRRLASTSRLVLTFEVMMYLVHILLGFVAFVGSSAAASSQRLPNSDSLEALQSAVNQTYHELSIKLPQEIGEALAKGRRFEAEEIHRLINREKRRLLSTLAVEVLYDYSHLPLLLVKPMEPHQRVTALQHPQVESVTPALLFSTALSATDSSAQIGAGTMRQLGFNGASASVLVTDTGIDIQNIHPDFGVCTSVGTPGTCKLSSYLDLGNDYDLLDGSSHGTNVAGIIALTAPGARIHHVNIDCGSEDDPQCVRGALAMQGLNWAIQNQAEQNIVAHNMSWGSDGTCSYQSSMNAGISAGIAQIAASGNDFFTNRVSSPANCNGVFSVGRVNTAFGSWSVANSSNVYANLDFLAPGQSIDAAGTLGYSGTSMAAPHVTGVTAILQMPNQWDGIPPARIEEVMKWSGVPFLDPRVDLSFPLVNAYAARLLSVRVVNRDEVMFSLTPASPKSCGINCYSYPETTVTATYPEGYAMTGCLRLSTTSCRIEVRSDRSHRLLRREKMISMLTTFSAPRESFSNGFE